MRWQEFLLWQNNDCWFPMTRQNLSIDSACWVLLKKRPLCTCWFPAYEAERTRTVLIIPRSGKILSPRFYLYTEVPIIDIIWLPREKIRKASLKVNEKTQKHSISYWLAVVLTCIKVKAPAFILYLHWISNNCTELPYNHILTFTNFESTHLNCLYSLLYFSPIQDVPMSGMCSANKCISFLHN